MFKKSRSKVLVEDGSEEDDMSWYRHHSHQDKDLEGEEEEEEAMPAVSKEAKVKKIMRGERKEKKMFSSKDDEHLLLTGVKQAAHRGSHKKLKDDEKEKEKEKEKEREKERKDKPEKSLCFWESVTMTMRQISPAKKLEKMEGWEPPRLENVSESGTDEAPEEEGRKGDSPVSSTDSLGLPLEPASWAGQGLEEDSSRYANLSDSTNPATAVRWTARAKVKLAGISRMSRGIVSEGTWEGFK